MLRFDLHWHQFAQLHQERNKPRPQFQSEWASRSASGLPLPSVLPSVLVLGSKMKLRTEGI